MRRARVDGRGEIHCRNCGSDQLLARSSERGKRTKHLKCAECGTRQRHRERRPVHA